MTFDATPPRAPIGALRISSIALAGVIVAVSVSVVAATFAMASQVPDQRAVVAVRAAGPVSRIVLSDSESDVHLTGDPNATGVQGRALVQWKGKNGKRPVLKQSFADGVLTLTKDCSGGGCGPVDITLTVPRGVSVRATTSDGRIAVSGVTGALDLTSRNGGIEGDGLGSANCSFATTLGDIDVSFTGAPARISARTEHGDVTIGTDGRTAYYDSVSISHGTTALTNNQDRRAADEIDVTADDGDVTIR